jgi:exodeoxyribonuclease V gamma subunit
LERRLSEALEPLEVDLPLAGFRLQGRLDGLQPTGLLDSRLGSLKAKDRLRAWVRHLVLNCLAPKGIEPASTWLAKDLTLTLRPVEDPAALLADLLDLRWQGLRRPLAFFPESSLAWVEQGYGNAFEQAWSGRYNAVPEQADVAVRIAFRGRDPIRDDPVRADFERTAARVLQPMLACSETLRADR